MIRNYIKLALKVLRRRKFFTFISLFGISLTLVVLVVATAALDNVFVPRTPESRFERALVIYTMAMRGPEASRHGAIGYKMADKYVRGLPSAEKVTVFTTPHGVVIYSDGRSIDSYIRRTDGAYWEVLDHTFLEGAPFTQADDDAGRSVAVITDQLRTKLFGEESALGRTVELGDDRFRVVGVVRSMPITRIAGFSEVWAPIGTLRDSSYRDDLAGDFGAVVLARSRADFPKLRAEFAERVRSVQIDDRDFDTIVAGLDTTFEAVAHTITNHRVENAPMIIRSILLLAALLFITLPTLNLVTINLSRIMERASEIGVRKAFGASKRSLVGQFVVENVVLTVIGGVIGFVLSIFVVAWVNRLTVIPNAHFDMNLRIFLWGLAIAVIFGVLSGAYPAWRMSRLHPVNALRGGSL